jgi:membrane protein implicated in regulation of membrane protease activity
MMLLDEKEPASSMRFDAFDGVCGQEGTVTEVIRPGKEWRVSVDGVYWSANALTYVELFPGDDFQVIGRKGIKLMIRPV